MPGIAKLLAGFGLVKGLQIGGYGLVNVAGSEHSIVRYREYEYMVQLTFEPIYAGYNSATLLNMLYNNYLTPPRIIASDYGNPYLCHFDYPTVIQMSGGTIVVNAVAHSTRQ